jgi:hypothetical protein
MGSWSKSQDQTLTEKWGTEPASAIGKRIGKSRNAVIGRAYRLRLPDMSGRWAGAPTLRTPEGEARRLAAYRECLRDPDWREKHREACAIASRRRYQRERDQHA